MAKKEKVSKGFGFYLLMLILLLVAAFMIIVVIMLFSPHQVILGYQYFYNRENENVKIYNAGGTELSEWSFKDFNKITINAKNSAVIITQGKNEKDQIQIKNNSIGFARGSDDVTFSYSVIADGKNLNINVSEPQGFLYFMRENEIILSLPAESEYAFENTQFDITTVEGAVTIGNTGTGDAAQVLDINNLAIKTRSGAINITEKNDATFDLLNLTTSTGSVRTGLDEITVSQSKIVTTSGRLVFNKLKFTDSVDLQLGSGSFTADEVTGNIKFSGENPKLEITKLTGDFDANDANLNGGNIHIAEISGSTSIRDAQSTNITIDSAGKSIYIGTTSGNVTLGSVTGLSSQTIVTTTTGNITAHIDQRQVGTKNRFSSTSGNIELFYGLVTSQDIIQSESGNVTFEFRSGGENKFLLRLYSANETPYETLNNKINLTFIDNITSHYAFPFRVNGYTGDSYYINIITDGLITGNLKIKE